MVDHLCDDECGDPQHPRDGKVYPEGKVPIQEGKQVKETDQLELLKVQVPKRWLEKLEGRISDLQDIADDADNSAEEAQMYARDAEGAASEAVYASQRAQEKAYELHQEVDGILSDLNDLLREDDDDDR